jgi:hypothetical protein
MAVLLDPPAVPGERPRLQRTQQRTQRIDGSRQQEFLVCVGERMPAREPPHAQPQRQRPAEQRHGGAIDHVQQGQRARRGARLQAVEQPASVAVHEALDLAQRRAQGHGDPGATMIDLQGKGTPSRAPQHQIDARSLDDQAVRLLLRRARPRAIKPCLPTPGRARRDRP